MYIVFDVRTGWMTAFTLLRHRSRPWGNDGNEVNQRSLARGRVSEMGSLPGIMTGPILGGVPLAEAVKSQILVMSRQKNGTPQALSA